MRGTSRKTGLSEASSVASEETSLFLSMHSYLTALGHMGTRFRVGLLKRGQKSCSGVHYCRLKQRGERSLVTCFVQLDTFSHGGHFPRISGDNKCLIHGFKNLRSCLSWIVVIWLEVREHEKLFYTYLDIIQISKAEHMRTQYVTKQKLVSLIMITLSISLPYFLCFSLLS